MTQFMIMCGKYSTLSNYFNFKSFVTVTHSSTKLTHKYLKSKFDVILNHTHTDIHDAPNPTSNLFVVRITNADDN